MNRTPAPSPFSPSRFRRVAVASILAAPLLLALPLLSGCNREADSNAEMEQRIAAVEAKAAAAEKRAQNAERMAADKPLPLTPEAAAPPPEVAGADNDQSFGQPMNDTQPIDPAPANQAPSGQ